MNQSGVEVNPIMEHDRDVNGDVLYLCRCVVNEVPAEKSRIEQMDLTAVYQAAQRHMLTAAAAHALESAGVRNPAFIWAKERAARKMSMMDAEQAAILEQLEAAGIWYMPMKGAVLKNVYPVYGIRDMSDRDILFDEDRANDVRDIMLKLGYSAEEFKADYHDCYFKPPVHHFEMHRHLVGPLSGEKVYSYYLNTERLLRKDDENAFGYHLSGEDFYVFLVAHEYKHYYAEGTGLRSLLDTYVYLKNTGLDMNYVRREVRKLGIDDYEQLNRSLAMHLFGTGMLTDSEQKMLDYILDCGTYGKEENFARNLLEKKGKKGYFSSRLTLPYETMLEMYPVLKKVKILYPFCWLHRLVHGLIFKNAKFMSQLKAGLTWKEDRKP